MCENCRGLRPSSLQSASKSRNVSKSLSRPCWNVFWTFNLENCDFVPGINLPFGSGRERWRAEMFPLQPPEQTRKCCRVVEFQFLESPLNYVRDLGQHLPGCNSLLNYNILPSPSNQSVVIITPFLLLQCWEEGFMLVYIELGVWRLTTMLTLSTFSPPSTSPQYLYSYYKILPNLTR